MSTINANIGDYFKKIEELTNTNLNILKAINESFTTNRKNVSVTIGDTTYTVPSCLSIENKLNTLSNTVEGLFNIPSTGEACFNSDGNTRILKLLQYSCTPNSVNISDEINNFSISNNNILKELLTPTPTIKFNLTLPNDIFEVKVRKIIAKSDNAKKIFSNLLEDNSSISKDYGNIYQIISQDINSYEIYDTVHKLPTRTSSTGEGEYVVKSIVNSYIDLDGNDVYILEIDKEKSTNNNGTLCYKKFDGTIQSPLLEQKPDGSIKEVFLRNNDATGKVKLIGWDTNNSTITVKNINGDTLNIVPTNEFNVADNIAEDSKLFYFNADSIYSKEGTYDTTLSVTLEEDKYVYVSIAVINSNMNIQSEWGNGILINTNMLTLENEDIKFAEYYNNNVKNLGDALLEMTSSLSLPVTSISDDTYNMLTELKPLTDSSLLKVVEINTHLAKTTELHNVVNSLDSWNSEYKTVTDNINAINEEIYNLEINNASEDEINIKRNELIEYQNRLDKVYNAYNDYTNVYNSNLDNLNEYQPKYRIRGFIQPKFDNITFDNSNYTISIPDSNINVNVIGMEVQYYYKSINDVNDIDTVTMYTIKTDNDNTIEFVYPIWNKLEPQFRNRNLKYENNTLKWEYENSTLINTPKFNQIDIPITTGERVVMRVRMIYDLGQPFNTVASKWSDDIDVEFPSDLIYDKNHINNTLTTTNNNIQKITAIDIIKNMGVEKHLNDTHTQNGYNFVHQAKNIDSGFKSSEQNVISLEEKLREMINEITELKSNLIEGYKNLEVSLTVGSYETPLYTDRDNVINLEAYNSIRESVLDEDDSTDNNSSGLEMADALYDETGDNSYNVGEPIKTTLYLNKGYLKSKGVVYTTININLKNTGDSNIRLYSLFPGNRDVILNKSNTKFVKLSDYCGTNHHEGIWFKFSSSEAESAKLQTQNQFIMFRMNDVYTGENYYIPNMSVYATNNLQSSLYIAKLSSTDKLGMVIYPNPSTEYGMCIDGDTKNSYITIAPGEQIVVPMACEFVVSENNGEIKKTISFDLRVSLYNDPINYSFTTVARNNVNPFTTVATNNKVNYLKNIKSVFNIK